MTNGKDENGSDDVSAVDGGAQQAGEATHEELLLTLQDAREQADAHWNELLRARAELVNLQRRAERDVENAHKYGLEKFVSELLPVLDSLELGLNAADAAGGAAQDKLREGVELTLKMLVGAVGKFGVQVVDPRGERFDPALHQAMSMQPAPAGVEAGRVLAVYQKGYLLNDRLVRPAMVVVAGPAQAAGAGEAGGKIDELA
jgi:molecular chaperone GrpE